MLAAWVGASSKRFFIRPLVVTIICPPRNPLSKRVVLTIRRREVRRLRRYLPGYFCVLQSAAGKIVRRHRDFGVIADKQRASSLSLRGHFKLGPAKLLHLKTVRVVLAIEGFHRTLRFELDLSVSQIHVRGKFEGGINSTEDIRSQFAF